MFPICGTGLVHGRVFPPTEKAIWNSHQDAAASPRTRRAPTPSPGLLASSLPAGAGSAVGKPSSLELRARGCKPTLKRSLNPAGVDVAGPLPLSQGYRRCFPPPDEAGSSLQGGGAVLGARVGALGTGQGFWVNQPLLPSLHLWIRPGGSGSCPGLHSQWDQFGGPPPAFPRQAAASPDGCLGMQHHGPCACRHIPGHGDAHRVTQGLQGGSSSQTGDELQQWGCLCLCPSALPSPGPGQLQSRQAWEPGSSRAS